MTSSSTESQPIRLIIDTDPGIDDAMAILAAFADPRVHVLALTATYGNVDTETAVRNACYLCDASGQNESVRVARGAPGPLCLNGAPATRIASFVHGEDGFGNTRIFSQDIDHFDIRQEVEGGGGSGSQPTTPRTPTRGTSGKATSSSSGNSSPTATPERRCSLKHRATSSGTSSRLEQGKTAADLIVEIVNAEPANTVTVLALGNLTNLCLALRQDASIAKRIKDVVILGGAFFTNGNVNPSAEANIHADAEAADEVFGSGAKCTVVGLDVTQKCVLSASQLDALGQSGNADFVHRISKFYLDFHRSSSGVDGIYLHDPTALLAATDPELFTFTSGPIRVVTEGVAMGCTIMDASGKSDRYKEGNPWHKRPLVKVALKVDADAVTDKVFALLHLSGDVMVHRPIVDAMNAAKRGCVIM